MRRAVIGLAACVLLACISALPALADTPANCTHEDYRGTWVYSYGEILPQPTGQSVNCTDFVPVETETITLSGLNEARDTDGNKGNWTMIYNQGAEVWIDGTIMFAFAGFNMASGAFNCRKSMPGWAHDADGSNWRCIQMTKVADEKTKLGAPTAAAPKALPADVVAATQELAFKRLNSPKRTERRFKTDHAYLAKINAAQDLFTVKHYPEFDGKTIGELERMGGSPYSAGSPLLAQLADAQAQPIRAPKLAAKDIPANFDWRNVSGVNYVSPVRSQASCGSCYAYAATAMMEARIRVASNNKQQPILSTQDVVSCSNYAQGCHGGFPYLISKYARDFGYAEESCYPYEGVDSACTPKPQADCNPQRWHAAEYYYIGGFYGQSTEQRMQEEMMAHGPIAVSFMVYPDFKSYAGGVYSHSYARALGLDNDGYNPFHLTNHAVTAVGWGVTDDAKKTPYWIVKNSWGPNWGESGYFRILRGSAEAGGECAIESLTVSAIPVLH